MPRRDCFSILDTSELAYFMLMEQITGEDLGANLSGKQYLAVLGGD